MMLFHQYSHNGTLAVFAEDPDTTEIVLFRTDKPKVHFAEERVGITFEESVLIDGQLEESVLVEWQSEESGLTDGQSTRDKAWLKLFRPYVHLNDQHSRDILHPLVVAYNKYYNVQ